MLFSISALTAAAGVGKNKGDDPFDLGGSSSSSSRNGRANVDDIMNLGGGMSGPMLAPPPLMAPVVEAPPPPPPPVAPVAAMPAPAMGMGADGHGHAPRQMAPYPQPKSKAPLVLGIVAAVALLGGVGVFFALRPAAASTAGAGDRHHDHRGHRGHDGRHRWAATGPQTTATAARADAPSPPTPAAAGPQTHSRAARRLPPPPSWPRRTPASPSWAGPSKPPSPSPTRPSPSPSRSSSPSPSRSPKPEPEKAKPPEPGGGGKEFDRGAAMSALSAASGAARGCKKDDGPTGTARVRVTFSPSGSVVSASVDGPPFAGTSVGACIAAAFRGAHIPPYDGPPQPVSKSVSIN